MHKNKFKLFLAIVAILTIAHCGRNQENPLPNLTIGSSLGTSTQYSAAQTTKLSLQVAPGDGASDMDAVTSAILYYTTDGTGPTTSSTSLILDLTKGVSDSGTTTFTAGDSIPITAATTLKVTAAIVVDHPTQKKNNTGPAKKSDGSVGITSDVASFAYTFASTPTATPTPTPTPLVCNSTTSLVDQQSNDGGLQITNANPHAYGLAQGFTTTSATYVKSISFLFYQNGAQTSLPSTVTIGIQGNSAGSPDGNVIASATVATSTIPIGGQTYTATFSTPALLSASTQYFAYVDCPTCSATKYFIVALQDTNPYSGGALVSKNVGGTWAGQSSGEDASFTVTTCN